MESSLHIFGAEPSLDVLVEALEVAARRLDIWTCYAHEGRFHFSLGHGLSIALSSDSADRIRVEACRLCRPVATMWVLAGANDRLAGLIGRMAGEVAEPV